MKKRIVALLLLTSLSLTACGLSSTQTIKDSEPVSEDSYSQETIGENATSYSVENYAGSSYKEKSGMRTEAYDGVTYYDAEYDVEFDTEEYNYQKENGFVSVASQPFSTFAADVDTASYANLRRQLRENGSVNPDSVRIEELINYFSYDLPEPNSNEPFSVTMELSDTPWNPDTRMLMVGLQAKQMDASSLPKSNLVFLIDVSGSMDSPNKLPLVQRTFMTLVENLRSTDRISIVTYSSGEEVIIDGKDGDSKNEIMSAIESLYASGSTDGESALQMAYEIAQKHFIKGGNNRIIMATDGDFNVGVTSEGELTRMIKEKAKSGIYLSILGYGMGNYKDNKLEALADNGNGNYAYIDDVAEARKVLIDEIGGTLFTVAKDVKLQVEFNPDAVKGYRLIGYENRLMDAEDFDDDTKDGGELGAGHSVIALYEVVFNDSAYKMSSVTSKYGSDSKTEILSDEYCTVNVRYKEPDGTKSNLLTYPAVISEYRKSPSKNAMWAAIVAETGTLIKQSPYAGSLTFDQLQEYAKELTSDDYRQEFVTMLSQLSRIVVDDYDRDYFGTPTYITLNTDDVAFDIELCNKLIQKYSELPIDDVESIEAVEKNIEDSLLIIYDVDVNSAQSLYNRYAKVYILFHDVSPKPLW